MKRLRSLYVTILNDTRYGCRKLSNEVCEAVSSLIFAASRQGGVIPELQILRLFFQRIFGQKFERINVDLLPGNKVNSGIVRNLDIIKTVSENVTNEIISEIWKEVKQNPGARLSDSPYYGVASADGIASFAAIKGAKKTAIVQEKKEKDFVAGRNEKVTKTTYKVNAYDDDHRQEEHLQGEKSPEAIPKTPSHVHPKLPDYDDLVLKFRNLKG
ncbi:OLC1v1027007C1 [Oldenlandia corymbosa var. corymbosa]|uniref:OLC1v1027007C1 n=1 Tax=Oldenlandia corymbosa var. corymbosa TaxID=529605 RepID=A0AAV1C912_OLDCO|nr:OLC1v1027007C1 [Oldenlandia corymbosa var. corymbosa]